MVQDLQSTNPLDRQIQSYTPPNESGFTTHQINPETTPKNIVNRMNATKAIRHLFIIGTAIFCFTSLAIGQAMEGLQMKELTEKLQLNEQQQKALTPIVAQRDKAVKALMGNTSMGKLQKLRKVQEIQTNFRAQAGKVLTPEQTKKLEALQAERREKLLGS
jgi:hypothetical protein